MTKKTRKRGRPAPQSAGRSLPADLPAPEPVRQAPGRLAGVLLALAVVWTAVMLASLKWHFLDRFFAGASIGKMGIDFFQIPRGFNNLLAGNSVMLTEVGDYGPYATPYLNHPLVAVAIGSWASVFSPWAGYAAFVAVSLGLMFLGARVLASAFDTAASRAFVYVAVFCSLPAYLMLWAGQAHVLLVLALAMIFGGLMRLAQEPQPRRVFFLWIQLGILISLLSKPSVALMLPVLLIVPETRPKLLLPLAIYAVVSLAFLLLESLNPDGFNALHWLNMAKASSSPIQMLRIATPFENNVLTDNGVYSLPVIVGRTLGEPGAWGCLLKLPLVVIGALSFLPLMARQRRRRLRMVVVVAAACIPCHFLCYYPVQEYHYTALLLASAVLLWLWRSEANRRLRMLPAAAFLASLVTFLPTCTFLSPEDTARFWTMSALERVLPTAAVFLGLAAYAIALGWQERRLSLAKKGDRGSGDPVMLKHNLRAFGRQIAAASWRALPAAGAVALMAGTVMAAVYATAPWRVLTAPAKWTPRDRARHEETIEACCRRALNVKPDDSAAHFILGGALIRQGRIAEGVAHYESSVEINPDPYWLEDYGVLLLGQGRVDDAIAQFRRSVAIGPGNPAAENNLAVALGRRARFDEAIAHYRKALELKHDFANAKNNLAWLLATCPVDSLRNAGEAVELAKQACQSFNYKDPNKLDVLAAAYAEAGRFADALSIAQRALAAATQQNQEALAGEIRVRIAMYGVGMPFRLGSPGNAPPPAGRN